MKGVIFLFLLLVCGGIVAQEKEAIIQQRIELIAEQLGSESLDLTNIVEVLNYRYDDPLNLNSTTKEALEELGLLTEIQIHDLLLHRRMNGKLITIYELQSLRYWSLETIQLLLPFIYVDDKFDQLHVGFKDAIQHGKFEGFFRYQTIAEQKGGYLKVSDSILANSNAYYHGDAGRYYSRLRYSYRTNLSLGITAEKDPGEAFFRGNQKQGFDFYSAHAFYKGGKYLRSVALGDYQVQIGQGLNLWSGYAFGKTADVMNVKKNPLALRPYTSVDETRFLRGAAVDIGWKKFALLSFASVKKVDAAISLDSLADEFEFVSSINMTGLHRTTSENDRKNNLTEYIVGSNLRYTTQGLQVGLSTIYWGFDKVYHKSIKPYNQFDFRGRSFTSISAEYSYVFQNVHFFGEVSTTPHNSSFANLHGLLVAIDSRASLSLVYRDYQRGYQTLYNAGFSEGSRTQNEKGLYTGLKFRLNRSWKLNGYIDVFTFPWLKYQVNAPSRGYEWMLQPSYRPSRGVEVYARLRTQLRQKNSRDPDGSFTAVENVLQRNYRLHVDYQISDAIRLKSRIEYVTLNRKSNTPEQGVILYQDLLYKPKNFPVDLSLRYALFDTDSYDSRIYTYENNALYVFSVPSYYHQGSRAYVLVRYSFLKKCDLWLRYGRFIYANQKSLGSGPEEIAQPTKTDITVQLRIKL